MFFGFLGRSREILNEMKWKELCKELLQLILTMATFNKFPTDSLINIHAWLLQITNPGRCKTDKYSFLIET